MKLLIFGFVILLTTNLEAQENQFKPGNKYSPDSLRQWTNSVMKAVSEKHPGFYRYASKVTFDNLIDSTVQTIKDSLTELAYYRKIKPLFTQIGCLHTGVSLSREYQNYLDHTSTLIPIEVFIDSGKRVRITKNYDANKKIQIGCEVVSINGRAMSDILNRILKAIPSDGFNQTEKILLLNHRFAFWYQNIIEVNDIFKIETKSNGVTDSYELTGTTKESFPSLASLESNYKKPLEFEILNNIGVLKVHSFAKSTIKSNGQNFKRFSKDVFKQIKEKDVKSLIIDLRYNTGGSDGNAVKLASYFFDKPFRYWEKIEVTEKLAKEIKGAVKFIYRKPVKEGEMYTWRKAKLTNEFDYYLTQKPSRNNFKGKVYILTNGLCMSSCSDFVAILSHNNKALVIGQESGGGFQGNTSGIMPTAKLPMGIQLTIPLQKYTNAVDLTKNYGRGTIPDFEVIPDFDNWVNKKDVEMPLALRLINEN